MTPNHGINALRRLFRIRYRQGDPILDVLCQCIVTFAFYSNVCQIQRKHTCNLPGQAYRRVSIGVLSIGIVEVASTEVEVKPRGPTRAKRPGRSCTNSGTPSIDYVVRQLLVFIEIE